MRGWYDTGEGDWWAVWSKDGSWDLTAESAVDDIAARAIRDARYEVNRVCFSWAVRCTGGEVTAMRLTHDEVMQQQILAFNGPGRCWFAVHGNKANDMVVELCRDYDACMTLLGELESRSPYQESSSYAVRADNTDDALRVVRQELRRSEVTSPEVATALAPDDTQTNEQRLATLPVDVLVKVHAHMHRCLVELTADRGGWDDAKAEEVVNDDLNDLILALMSELADTGRLH